MRILGDLNFESANYINDVKLVLAIENSFPTVPQAGRVLFAGKRVMICVEIVDGVPVWVPLTGEISSHIHTQTQPSMTWTINHDFNTSSVFVQVIDADGRMIIPDEVDLSVINVVTLRFNHAVVGRAIIMLGSLSGLPKENVLFSQQFASATEWVVNHGLGYNPVIRCFIGDFEVQPYSIVHNSTTQATVTFTSPQAGYVNCL